MATRMAVNNIFRAMPEKDSQRLDRLKPRLLKLEGEIDEEVLTIVFADRAFSGTSALVVTPLRMIEVVERGGMEIIPFSDTTSVRVGPGRKKLFNWTGTAYTYTLYGDHASSRESPLPAPRVPSSRTPSPQFGKLVEDLQG